MGPDDGHTRGALTVYLGAVPGVGKTYALLEEAQARHQAGQKVAIGVLETHARADTDEMSFGLARVPMRQVAYRGTTFDEMDVDAVLDARPSVVLVDELAHRCVPGSRHERRWQDVEELLEAGIDVVTSLNVQHLESLTEEVAQCTGVRPRETVPDGVVSSATRVVFIDSPRGGYGRRSEAVVPGGGTGFSQANLDALRALGAAWLEKHGFGRPAPTSIDRTTGAPSQAQPPILVALTGDPDAEHVLRRAAALADLENAELIGSYVRVPSDRVESDPPWLAAQRELLLELGGRYAELAGVDVAATLLDFARKEGAGSLVLGATRRSRREELLHGSVINRAIRSAGQIEVHVVPPPGTAPRRGPTSGGSSSGRVVLPGPRRAVAWGMAVALPLIITSVLVPARSSVQLTGVLLCNLLGVVAVALLGGIRPALLATFIAFVASDFLFAPPFYSLRVGRWVDLIALVTFLVVAALVGWLVDRLARQGVRVARATAQDENLVTFAAQSLVAPDNLAGRLATLRAAFDLDAATLLRRSGKGWEILASCGHPVFHSPGEAPSAVEIASGTVLALSGASLERRERTLSRSLVDRLRSLRERQEVETLFGSGENP